jgi:hypothetical protein
VTTAPAACGVSDLDIVVTSIGAGDFVEPFADVAAAADLRVGLVVIPDRKTPATIFAACEAARARGVDVRSPSIGEQQTFMDSLGASELVPYDSDNRRNVGFLMALARGAHYIVAADDDNWPRSPAYVREHYGALGRQPEALTWEAGWFNPATLLQMDQPDVFLRGHPYAHRSANASAVTRREAHVCANEGLWIGDPDVDAVTRLAIMPIAREWTGGSMVLGPDAWAPINTQNTCVSRAALPSFYFVRMGDRIDGWTMERFGDIFAGLFLQACAKQVGETIRFGGPLVTHRRNAHDLLRDLRQELPAILLLEWVAEWIRDIALSGSQYVEAYRSLAASLDDAAARCARDVGTRDADAWLHLTATRMRHWLAAVAVVA